MGEDARAARGAGTLVAGSGEEADRDGGAVLVVLSIIALVFSLQQSLIVPALATVQRTLGTSASASTWLVTGFLLSSAVSIPIVGRLGDMFGRRRLMLFSLAVLASSNVLGAVTHHIGVLIAARVLQGLSGGTIPLSFGIVRDARPPHRVANDIGIVASMLAVGAAMGIVLSGPIVTTIGVQGLFWLPLIPLVPTAVAAWFVMPASRPGERQSIDLPGGLLLTAWLVCLLVPVGQSTTWGWGDRRTIVLLALSALLFVAWAVVEARSDAPLIDVHLLRGRTVATVNTVSFTAGFVVQSLFTFVTRFVQIPTSTGFGLGVPASKAGLVILPWSTCSFLTGVFYGRAAARFGPRRVLVFGAFLALPACALLVTHHDTVAWIAVAMAMTGTGTGILLAAMPAIVVAAVPVEHVGVSAGMNQNLRNIGGAIGAQAIAAIVAASVAPKESLYVTAFVVTGCVGVIGLVASIAVPRRVDA
jgi:MFS family permease